MFRAHKTKQLLTLSALAAAAALVAYIFLFLHIAREGRETSILQNDIDLVTQKESRLRSIQSTLKETEDDRARIDDYFIPNEGIVSFIESIEGFSGISGAVIDVSSVDVGPLSSETAGEETDAFAELVRLSFKAEGTWQEVIHTLALLESLPYSLTITRTTIQGGAVSEEGAPSRWSGFFTITAVKKK